MNILRTAVNLLTEPAAKNRAQGPDVSHWNVPRTPGKPIIAFDPDRATERIDFAFQKITEGETWVDPVVNENYLGIQKVPARFAYHYQRAGMSWTRQMNNFQTIGGRYDFHGYVLDVEKTNNWSGAAPITGDTFFMDTRRMLEHLMKYEGDKATILYINEDIYKNFLRPAFIRIYRDEGRLFLEENPRLWIWYAQYWYAWSVNKEPSLPPGMKPWDFWQITEKGKGTDWGVMSGDVDVNVYNGTPAQLYARLKIGAPTEEPPTQPPPVVIPPTDPETLPETWTGSVVTFGRLKVRSYPQATDATDTGHRFLYGERVSGKLWTGNGYVWMKMDGTVPESIKGKWAAVRSEIGEQFIKLDKLPAPPPVQPPATPPDGLITVRVVWDDENPNYLWKCRTLTEKQIKSKAPPAVNRYYPKPIDKMGDFRVNLSIPHDWEDAIIELNGGGQEGIRRWKYLTGKARATYNKAGASESGWPYQMYVAFSGNTLRGRFIGGWFEFETLKPEDLGKVGGMTIQSHPHLVHRFTCVGWNGILKRTKRISSTNTQHGQVYHYLVTREGKGYIPARHVVRVP
jgi:GH25 family lysozyme M1 (1,4-beta-N-acetylmuramidase)